MVEGAIGVQYQYYNMLKISDFSTFRIGTNVPLIKKGRFGVVHESVSKHLQPCHLTLETDSTTDITKEKILQMVSLTLCFTQP